MTSASFAAEEEYKIETLFWSQSSKLASVRMALDGAQYLMACRKGDRFSENQAHVGVCMDAAVYLGADLT